LLLLHYFSDFGCRRFSRNLPTHHVYLALKRSLSTAEAEDATKLFEEFEDQLESPRASNATFLFVEKLTYDSGLIKFLTSSRSSVRFLTLRNVTELKDLSSSLRELATASSLVSLDYESPGEHRRLYLLSA
jgi:hypothetical protein